jgi:hypothetical protein
MKYTPLLKKMVITGIFLIFITVPFAQALSSSQISPATNNTNFETIQEKTTTSVQYLASQEIKGSKEKSIQFTADDPVYPLLPDWESGSPAYSTGGALADLNNDNWLDLVVSDGNDMSPGYVRVYLNDGSGHLPTQASWQSADIAYNGHLDVADVNGDGWLDVAVSYLGSGTSHGPIARLYLNNNGILSSNPDWTSTISGHAFGVDFGDMNNDGRPDLAIATGDAYDSSYFHTYVYLNTDGSFGSSPSWESADQNIYMGCLWVDADDDGWLDLAGIGSETQTQIYRNLGGELETTASWHTMDSANQFGIMLASGDVTGDGIRDLFATDNNQLSGGDKYFKQYTGLSTGFFETTHTWEFIAGCGSTVALADVNGDNLLDLATGAWWEHTNLFLNQGTGLPTTPSWTSTHSPVAEKIVFGNVGPESNEHIYTEHFTAGRSLVYLSHRQIQRINAVVCDGATLTPAEYTYSRDEGWVTVGTTPVHFLNVTYTYSFSQDMVVTNWDPNVGNFLYYNLLNFSISYPDLDCSGALSWEDIEPGGTVQGNFTISNVGDPFSLLDWEITQYPTWGAWSFTPSSGKNLTAGESVTVHVVVVAPDEKNKDFQGDVRVYNTENPDDFGVIHVRLKTPYSLSYQTSLYQRMNHLYETLQSLWRIHFHSYQS